MPETIHEKSACFLALPLAPEFEEIRNAVTAAVSKADFRAVWFHDEPGTGHVIRELLMGQLAQADCVVVDLTDRIPNVYFELGIAQAMGKAVFPIVRFDAVDAIPVELLDVQFLKYETTSRGRRKLTQELTNALEEFRKSPRRAQFIQGARVSTPFFIDWDKLDQSDVENLCRELLSQMGLRRVDWHRESKEIDLIAEYPRKDPDGFEYRELWLISMGRNMPMEMIAEMTGPEPEFFLRHLLRDEDRLWLDEETASVTLLFIAWRGRPSPEFDMIRRRFSGKMRRRGGMPTLRVRLWDREYLTSLVQQFPSIGFKYFSDEARSQSKFRKGPEELYHENIALADRLAKTLVDLKDETNRRIRAERDSVWKDISFAAAHKIGNPIFAIETDLGPLEKRINENRKPETLEVITNIRAAVEKAKGIVEQFKSLTKAQQVTLVPTLLQPILTDCCKFLKASNIQCVVECPNNIRILGDPERLSEVFDELATNALHWLDKSEKRISVTASIAESSSLPSAVDSTRRYVLIHFRDNGSGVAFEDKPRIFEAFFSTYDQGTGLGLALVRRIVEGHGGVIREEGVPGQGADFEIYLPLAEEATK